MGGEYAEIPSTMLMVPTVLGNYATTSQVATSQIGTTGPHIFQTDIYSSMFPIQQTNTVGTTTQATQQLPIPIIPRQEFMQQVVIGRIDAPQVNNGRTTAFCQPIYTTGVTMPTTKPQVSYQAQAPLQIGANLVTGGGIVPQQGAGLAG